MERSIKAVEGTPHLRGGHPPFKGGDLEMDIFFATALAVLGFVLASLGIINRILKKLNESVRLLSKLRTSLRLFNKKKKDKADSLPRQGS